MLTKAIYEFHEELVLAHRAMAFTIEENAFKGMTIPLHPGSVKYFDERGIKIPDEIRP